MIYGVLSVHGPRPNGYWTELKRENHETLKSDRFPSMASAIGETVATMLENNDGEPMSLTFIDETD